MLSRRAVPGTSTTYRAAYGRNYNSDKFTKQICWIWLKNRHLGQNCPNQPLFSGNLEQNTKTSHYIPAVLSKIAKTSRCSGEKQHTLNAVCTKNKKQGNKTTPNKRKTHPHTGSIQVSTTQLVKMSVDPASSSSRKKKKKIVELTADAVRIF